MNTVSQDSLFLERCVSLAEEAVAAGDQAFGSVLVSKEGKILAEDRNRINSLHALAHPEYALAKWAAEHLTKEERASSTLYTSGEHCPMCAAAHGWAGLGTIVYLSSSAELSDWLAQHGISRSLVASLPVQEVIPGVKVRGPYPGALHEKLYALHKRAFLKEA